ncbi:AT-rich interactive domain-containing protein 5-like [Solanum tuberosum]|uniref:AT-rich interactive domain-containing protein 5-like n=1 Tax=Solanum tuberosum TaxID=4113 RepID=UPI00073A0B49|nr:PREDICTED: AT-rich interactive domain-containing protein 5-like [Solanum tuberosum]
MDKGDVEMLDAEKNVPASDVLVSNESPVKYENGVKTGKSNAEDKKDDHSDSKGEELKNARSEVIDDELQNIEKMIYEVNQNGNDLMVDRQEDSQMKTIPTNVITDSFIGKMPEPASPMFPSTANARHYSGEASENICAMMADGKDDEGSPEDQAAFIGKLGTFYREKAMELKLPKFYGHSLNCLKLWRSVIKLGGYDRVTRLKLWRQMGDSFNPPKTCTTVSWTFCGFYEKLLLPYERHRTQNGELQLPIAAPPVSWGVDNEGSDYQSSASGRVVRDSAARCRLGWQEQHLLGYGEVAEPIVKDRNANNMPKRAKSLKNSGKIVRQFFANSYISIIELLSPHHFPI